MATREGRIEHLRRAVALAQAGDWKEAHGIVQKYSDDKLGCWIHGVLHKIENDTVNARYWYARCDHSFGAYSDVNVELAAIDRQLQNETES